MAQSNGCGDENSSTLREIARAHGVEIDDPKFCAIMDERDPVKNLRREFFYPKMGDLPTVDLSLVDPQDDCIYLCGNSLGLQPRGVEKYLKREMDKWSKMGVLGHFRGDLPWARCDDHAVEGMARLVGARPSEIALMNGLSVNLHLMMISFYRPTAKRYKILLEQKAFPSDHFVIESQARFHGYNPHDAMIILEPRPDEYHLRTEDILKCIRERGDEIALVLFSGVQYYTGQLFDIPTITTAAQEKGCVVGWDMAHAVGNVPLHLHDWRIDFAVWCSYKYVNSSAGGIGAVFLHERHARNDYPKFSGWWSDHPKHRMNMTNELHLTPGADGYRISNPPPFLVCPLLASLDIFAKTSMMQLREKSILLTGYLEYLLDRFLCVDSPHRRTSAHCRIITPRSSRDRGCQLSLMFSVELDLVFVELEKRGVVCDKRLPYVLRVAPVHLYNSFNDVKRFVDILVECLKSCENEKL